MIDRGLTNIQALVKLNLISNELILCNKIVPDCVWNHLENILVNDNYFKKLDFSNTNIGYVQMKIIHNFVITLKALTHLILERNNLNDKSCELISLILIKTQIKYLSLSFNFITNQGITLLSPSILKAEKIENINLANNKIGEPGFTILYKNANQSKTLHCIDLTNNPIKLKSSKASIFPDKKYNLNIKLSP